MYLVILIGMSYILKTFIPESIIRLGGGGGGRGGSGRGRGREGMAEGERKGEWSGRGREGRIIYLVQKKGILSLGIFFPNILRAAT